MSTSPYTLILMSFRSLHLEHTLKRAPTFMPYFVLASSIMHLTLMAQTVQMNKLDTPVRIYPHLSEAVKQGIARLIEMRSRHQIAEQAFHLHCHLTKKWNIDVNIDTGVALDPEVYERLVRSFGGMTKLFSSIVVAQDSFSDIITG
jgi:hypothetical protein